MAQQMLFGGAVGFLAYSAGLTVGVYKRGLGYGGAILCGLAAFILFCAAGSMS